MNSPEMPKEIERQEGAVQLEIPLEEIKQSALNNGFEVREYGSVSKGPESHTGKFMMVIISPEVKAGFWSVNEEGKEVTKSFPSHAKLFAEAVNSDK